MGFLTESEPTYGVAFSPVVVPDDTTAHGLRYLAMRLESDSGINAASVRVDHGVDGTFTRSAQLVYDAGLQAYSGFIDTSPFRLDQYITW